MGKFAKRKEGKIVSKDAQDRPGYVATKAPKSLPTAKPVKKTSIAVEKASEPEPTIPLALQQLLLDIFRDAFAELLMGEKLQAVLQEVKGALYERDFGRAFGNEEFLEAYALRWSPSRAVGYVCVLSDVREHFKGITGLCGRRVEGELEVVCFGGGAAEVVGFGGFLKFLLDTAPAKARVETVEGALGELKVGEEPRIKLNLVDTASWGAVTKKLNEGLVGLPTLSKYTNAAAREANSSLLAPGNIATTFQADDILALSQTQIAEMVGGGEKLLTLLFTLNELYTASMGKTTTFLLNLTLAAKPGTLLLVVDSPGSYSETMVGSESKKYPMKWLLDHTLLEKENKDDKDSLAKWEKIVSEDSRWFRLANSLQYPIPLENMRYQIHLYRRLPPKIIVTSQD